MIFADDGGKQKNLQNSHWETATILSHHIFPLPYLPLKDMWDAALEVGQICAGKQWSWQTELAQ